MTHTVRIEYDETTDEYIIPLGDELCNTLGWNAGDTIDWKENGDGSYTLAKVEKKMEKVQTELVLVEAVSSFRMRYVVEVPVGKKEWALDTVTMNQAEEFSQEHIGEQIISHRVITDEEYNCIFDEDNDYLKNWTNEQKRQFITPLPEHERNDIEHSRFWNEIDRNK